MARMLGPGIVYVVGRPGGPTKVGMTTTSQPKARWYAARAEREDESLSLYGSWPHPYAYLVEKFSHFYLQDFHEYGEWFTIDPECAVDAVKETIGAIRPTGKRRKSQSQNDWLSMAGLTPDEADAYFASRPRSGDKVDTPHFRGHVSLHLIEMYPMIHRMSQRRTKAGRDAVKARKAKESELFWEWMGGKEAFLAEHEAKRLEKAARAAKGSAA
jgi:hypothetical protein